MSQCQVQRGAILVESLERFCSGHKISCSAVNERKREKVQRDKTFGNKTQICARSKAHSTQEVLLEPVRLRRVEWQSDDAERKVGFNCPLTWSQEGTVTK